MPMKKISSSHGCKVSYMFSQLDSFGILGPHKAEVFIAILDRASGLLSALSLWIIGLQPMTGSNKQCTVCTKEEGAAPSHGRSAEVKKAVQLLR